MIAIDVLRDAQKQIAPQISRRPKVRCFFSENNREAFAKLGVAIKPYHKPAEGFEIQKTSCPFVTLQ